MNIQIGDEFWELAATYKPGQEFKRVQVVGETSVSWIIGSDPKYEFDRFKVPKRDPFGDNGDKYPRVYNDVDKTEWLFMANHKYHISRKVESVKNVETLRKIAELINYNESGET
jgi:hypothetical protein